MEHPLTTPGILVNVPLGVGCRKSQAVTKTAALPERGSRSRLRVAGLCSLGGLQASCNILALSGSAVERIGHCSQGIWEKCEAESAVSEAEEQHAGSDGNSLVYYIIA